MPAPSPRDLTREFLSGMLKDGPHTSRAIWAEGQKLCLKEITLRRAKDALGVRAVRVWADGKRLSYWLLPGQKLSEAAGRRSKEI